MPAAVVSVIDGDGYSVDGCPVHPSDPAYPTGREPERLQASPAGAAAPHRRPLRSQRALDPDHRRLPEPVRVDPETQTVYAGGAVSAAPLKLNGHEGLPQRLFRVGVDPRGFRVPHHGII